MAKQEMVAMLLAGGQGSRLGVLTEKVAKPAVPFGSRYRIIDFPLSNCTNSGVETVGVLTQYQPLELNDYMGNGHSWDLDRSSGGLSVLPPYESKGGMDWYKGTANAIYQNIPFIERYKPRYVLILSGDHIYKMNYAEMLKTHISGGAAGTIAVIEVPWEEASRFGIMNTDAKGQVVSFEEKPREPKNNLASMGIYIFDWPILRKFLKEDEADPHSQNDFGKNIIPNMLKSGQKLMTHTFTGYWKDVGTIYSLWEANMDLLDHSDQLDLHDASWRIYARNAFRPPHRIGSNAVVEESCLTDGDLINGEVYHSIVSDSVVVEAGAVIRDSILMPGVTVRRGCQLDHCIVGMGAEIGAGTLIGNFPDANNNYVNKLCSHGISVIQPGVRVRAGSRIGENSMIRQEEDGRASDVLEARPLD